MTFAPNWYVADLRPRNLGNWTWTVNVTDVPTSNFHEPVAGSTAGSRNYTNPHFVNTVYSLQWPGGGELTTYLNNATHNASGLSATLCMATVQLQGLPSNVTDKFQPSDNGDCSSVLGPECVRAYLSALTTNNIVADSCAAGPQFSSIKECNSTLAVAPCGGSVGYGEHATLQNWIEQGTNMVCSLYSAREFPHRDFQQRYQHHSEL